MAVPFPKLHSVLGKHTPWPVLGRITILVFLGENLMGIHRSSQARDLSMTLCMMSHSALYKIISNTNHISSSLRQEVTGNKVLRNQGCSPLEALGIPAMLVVTRIH
jgi:hypothetical protein